MVRLRQALHIPGLALDQVPECHPSQAHAFRQVLACEVKVP